MAEKRFLKIKVRDEEGKNRVHIEYETKNGRDWDQFAMDSVDKAAPEFYAALQTLGQDVLEMCELPAGKLIIVKGVSFSYGGEKEVMGATITATMRLLKSNVPLNLNTPHKAEEPYAETGDPKQLLDSRCVERLKHLQDCADDFIGGIREQLDAFASAGVGTAK